LCGKDRRTGTIKRGGGNLFVDFLYLYGLMRPDYPHKTFRDKRFNYILLLESLAMDSSFLP
jgi:hypothetical protein